MKNAAQILCFVLVISLNCCYAKNDFEQSLKTALKTFQPDNIDQTSNYAKLFSEKEKTSIGYLKSQTLVIIKSSSEKISKKFRELVNQGKIHGNNKVSQVWKDVDQCLASNEVPFNSPSIQARIVFYHQNNPVLNFEEISLYSVKEWMKGTIHKLISPEGTFLFEYLNFVGKKSKFFEKVYSFWKLGRDENKKQGYDLEDPWFFLQNVHSEVHELFTNQLGDVKNVPALTKENKKILADDLLSPHEHLQCLSNIKKDGFKVTLIRVLRKKIEKLSDESTVPKTDNLNALAQKLMSLAGTKTDVKRLLQANSGSSKNIPVLGNDLDAIMGDLPVHVSSTQAFNNVVYSFVWQYNQSNDFRSFIDKTVGMSPNLGFLRFIVSYAGQRVSNTDRWRAELLSQVYDGSNQDGLKTINCGEKAMDVINKLMLPIFPTMKCKCSDGQPSDSSLKYYKEYYDLNSVAFVGEAIMQHPDNDQSKCPKCKDGVGMNNIVFIGVNPKTPVKFNGMKYHGKSIKLNGEVYLLKAFIYFSEGQTMAICIDYKNNWYSCKDNQGIPSTSSPSDTLEFNVELLVYIKEGIVTNKLAAQVMPALDLHRNGLEDVEQYTRLLSNSKMKQIEENVDKIMKEDRGERFQGDHEKYQHIAIMNALDEEVSKKFDTFITEILECEDCSFKKVWKEIDSDSNTKEDPFNSPMAKSKIIYSHEYHPTVDIAIVAVKEWINRMMDKLVSKERNIVEKYLPVFDDEIECFHEIYSSWKTGKTKDEKNNINKNNQWYFMQAIYGKIEEMFLNRLRTINEVSLGKEKRITLVKHILTHEELLECLSIKENKIDFKNELVKILQRKIERIPQRIRTKTLKELMAPSHAEGSGNVALDDVTDNLEKMINDGKLSQNEPHKRVFKEFKLLRNGRVENREGQIVHLTGSCASDAVFHSAGLLYSFCEGVQSMFNDIIGKDAEAFFFRFIVYYVENGDTRQVYEWRSDFLWEIQRVNEEKMERFRQKNGMKMVDVATNSMNAINRFMSIVLPSVIVPSCECGKEKQLEYGVIPVAHDSVQGIKVKQLQIEVNKFYDRVIKCNSCGKERKKHFNNLIHIDLANNFLIEKDVTHSDVPKGLVLGPKKYTLQVYINYHGTATTAHATTNFLHGKEWKCYDDNEDKPIESRKNFIPMILMYVENSCL